MHDTSIFFARALGIVFLVGGLEALFNRKAMSRAIDGAMDQPVAFWIVGLINLLLGAFMVAVQEVWSADWRVVVTIIGWSALFKGAILWLFPDFSRSVYRACNRVGVLAFGGVVAILLGLFLCYAGFRL